jgi:hypothetical protein
MAELDDKSGEDFGITNTINLESSGAGDQSLLADLLADESDAAIGNASPDTISSIEKEEEKEDKETKTENEDKVEDKKNSSLSDFLSTEETNNTEEEIDSGVDNDIEKENNIDVEESASNISENNDQSNDDSQDVDIKFDSLSNQLADLGVFSRNEGEEDTLNVGSPEEFLERWKAEKQKGAQEIVSDFIGQFGQDYQDAFSAIYVNGVDPKTYFSKSSGISDFSSMDLEDEKNQKDVVRTMLSEQGYESEDVESELEKLINYGDLEDASKRYHKVLVKKQKASLEIETQKAQREQQIKSAQQQEYVSNIQNVLQDRLKAKQFDGIPLNAKTANELQDFLLVDKWKTQSGEKLTDFDKAILDLKKPENHEQKVKVAMILRLLEKDPTLSTIQKTGISKKSSQLFKDVARQKTAADKQSVARKKQDPKSWFQ